MRDLIHPYREHDYKLREIFAQQPDHPAISESYCVPLFAGHESDVRTRARDLDLESEQERQRYIMPLDAALRKVDGSPAVVQSFKEFQTNFSIFTESSLSDMDWSNVAAAGSAVLTSLLPVPKKHKTSKRALRQYYHEKIAPASDVDLYLYDLTEDQAKEKIKQIEQHVRDSLLTETTTIRTKNAITIASHYPTRHIQIVLRIYRSITEMLLGFDVDCSCIVYDGKQIYASPRSLAACMTQCNTLDLTYRSPSYERRLAKYSHRGFEVYWPLLDRSRIDPTIFERSFKRTQGLARLLVLERLPKVSDRDAYVDQRRAERGRPSIDRDEYTLPGNIKDRHDEEVADVIDEEEVSNYHTFTIPYGPKYTARKIEKLLYRKDLLLNAEWNRSENREVNLHRHPAFFGRVEDVLKDCCGYCPKPVTPEEVEVAEKEGKTFISGPVTFLKDNPGRQAIGSFFPLTADDWTEMGYIGSTSVLCRAIVDHDLGQVEDWLSQDGADPNCRDHTGRTPLQLAVISSTAEIVQCLIDRGARIVARMVDGNTALHLAAIRGNVAMVSALLRKSEENEEIEASKVSERSRRLSNEDSEVSASKAEFIVEQDDIEFIEKTDGGLTSATTDHSFVKVVSEKPTDEEVGMPDEVDDNEPDVYDVGVVAWDVALSPIHLAVAHGHVNVVNTLVQDFGASPAQPLKLLHKNSKAPLGSILPLVIALMLPFEQVKIMTKALIDLGASPAQGDFDQVSVLHAFATTSHEHFDMLFEMSPPIAARALNHVAMSGFAHRPQFSTPLCSAILSANIKTVEYLLRSGFSPQINFPSFSKSYQRRFEAYIARSAKKGEGDEATFHTHISQPVISAVECDFPELVSELLKHGADMNTLTKDGWKTISGPGFYPSGRGMSLLDLVRDKKDRLGRYMEHPPDPRPSLPWHISKPIPLKDDEEYLDGLVKGTYAEWSTSKQLEGAKIQYRAELERYEKHNNRKEEMTGLNEKFEAVRDLHDRFVALELELERAGAKTLKELHPDVPERDENAGRRIPQQIKDEKSKPWSPSLSFQSSDATDEREAAYRELFQACWDGDDETVKKLTLNVWRKDQGPLRIDVPDRNGFTTLAISIFRQHYQTAITSLEIARVQHDFKVQSDKSRFSTKAAESNEDDHSVSDDDEILHVVIETVDNEFTVDTIGELQIHARGELSPLQLLRMKMPVHNFLKRSESSTASSPTYTVPASANLGSLWAPPIDHETCRPGDLFQFAIFQNDLDLMSFLLDLAETQHEHEDGYSTFFQFPEDGFRFALQLGRTRILSEIISRTGCGFPLNELVVRSGVKVQTVPKSYQGLSIHGEKRADWARAGQDAQQTNIVSQHPLLLAAKFGNVLSIEWLQSDEPRECYIDFATVNRKDKRLESLAETKGGLPATIDHWLDRNTHLLLHCVILGGTKPDSRRLLEHLIKDHPSLINSKSLNGQTPLHLAFSLHRLDMVKVLIAAGADQTTRDKSGNNIIHSILCRDKGDPRIEPDLTKDLISSVDRRLLPSLFTELSTSDLGAATPLASWLSIRGKDIWWNGAWDKERNAKIMSLILSLSKGIELDMVNGAGQTPLHDVVKRTQLNTMNVILQCRPDLLYREDATGRTPYEIAHDAYFAEVFASPPDIPGIRIRQRGKIFLGDDHRRTLLDTDSEYFVKPFDPKSDKEKAWEMCKDFDRKAGSRTRKLVTLCEANEVMKRLATKKPQAQSGRRGSDKTPEEPKDEVDNWYSEALTRK